MRKIKGLDVITMARIIKKAQIKEELARIIPKLSLKNVNEEEIGIEMIFTILEGAGSAGVDKELWKLLEDISEEKNVSDMELEPLYELIKKLVKENNLIDFFKRAARLM